MFKLMKSLSDEEIKDYTEEGKGLTPAECTYYLLLCSTGYDSGTCSYILRECGYTGGGGGGTCGTCTCH
ncbi:hypothetical protein CE561_08525 [Thermoanaerobacterium thermosaccharolyticum]|uniref:Uncharacterized protein n=1 Tax=Thermoanaerobacterium thermosaccharolyticum TaxID=1517 RepID=A0A231VGG3_THETR|nr:glycocin F family RiPP peptide [Thermoanaerobacterium thermosaccharolyticum]OXT07234.1 hypothetical protein CE561_08525 [Thermoanaerobacterium thermosaccharolyticum]